MSATVTLSGEQLHALARETARLVAEELRGHRPTAQTGTGTSGMVDAFTVAQTLGVARSWVYQHAAELGAQRLGSGSRGRLRFDLTRARAAFTVAESEPKQPTRRARPRRRTSTAGSILRSRPGVPS